jgi:hypothetical protein
VIIRNRICAHEQQPDGHDRIAVAVFDRSGRRLRYVITRAGRRIYGVAAALLIAAARQRRDPPHTCRLTDDGDDDPTRVN